MEKLFIYTVVFCFMLSACNNRTDKCETIENKNVNKLRYTRKPTYSSATLRGTEWVADYSNKDHEYCIRFTDSLYICTQILFGKARDFAYPYYISEIPDRSFDWKKVGKETDGDYILSYDKESRFAETFPTEIFYASPTKLVIVQPVNDTISFTRRN